MDEKNPIPVVPIFLNTYYPPNQPRPHRCYAFGQAVRKAAEGFCVSPQGFTAIDLTSTTNHRWWARALRALSPPYGARHTASE